MSVKQTILTITMMLAVLLAGAAPALALDAEHKQKAEVVIARAIDYLRDSQNPDGSWTPRPGPAITGLVLAGMLRSPDIDRDDDDVNKALAYILQRQKPDGGIYDTALRNYNTAISVMALSKVEQNGKSIQKAIADAQKFFRKLQWVDQVDPQGKKLTPSHPYYGGAGYNDSKHGRPDLSNTVMMIAALHDSGIKADDPIMKRAMTYVSRCQGVAENDLFDAQTIVQDGGFIYATSINAKNIGTPQTRTDESKTEMVKAGGEYDGPLPTYGSITYAGYMSYLYADLDRNDPRVKAAQQWIANNYTVETNPRMGQRSYYYYMHFLARALGAHGEEQITVSEGVQHDWANDLIDALAKRQQDDGSWVNRADNWMEGDPNLCTAYSLIALQIALGR